MADEARSYFDDAGGTTAHAGAVRSSRLRLRGLKVTTRIMQIVAGADPAGDRDGRASGAKVASARRLGHAATAIPTWSQDSLHPRSA